MRRALLTAQGLSLLGLQAHQRSGMIAEILRNKLELKKYKSFKRQEKVYRQRRMCLWKKEMC